MKAKTQLAAETAKNFQSSLVLRHAKARVGSIETAREKSTLLIISAHAQIVCYEYR